MSEDGALSRVLRRLRDALTGQTGHVRVPEPEPVALEAAPSPLVADRFQVAALCWRGEGEKTEVLVITSRDTGRWVLPKGWIEAAEDAHDAAAREAWEEAGVEGTISDKAFGDYTYTKLVARGQDVLCHVDVFEMQVTRVAKDWPERRQRERRWVAPRKAAKLVNEPALQDILLRFAEAHRAAA